MLVIFLARRYKRCPSDKILVIYGKVGAGQSARCIHGGGTMVWPVIQNYQYLSLTPLTINIPLKNALSLQNIRIDVPSTFTVGISTQEAIMYNAAERLLNLKRSQIEEMAREIIFGQLRLTVASLTIEQINQDRESFLESIRKNVEPELNKIGLYLINVNITDITDESDYIESIGKKAAAEAINRAKVDVAEQEKVGAIGEAEAMRERQIQVAINEAEAEKGRMQAEADKRIFVKAREYNAIHGENAAMAKIAESNAQLNQAEAEAMRRGDVAKMEAEAAISKARALAERERLAADELVREEVDKRKVEIAAEAEAERRRREAAGEADAIRARYEAEAQGMQQLLAGKAEGYAELVRACNGDTRAAATLLMVEQIEGLVAHQVEAIKNLKIDKITVWDSGAGGGQGADGSTTTSNFLSGFIKSLPPLHELSRMAGIDLPDYLGRVSGAQNGAASSSAAPPAATDDQAEPAGAPQVDDHLPSD
jgi:flotillin